MSDRTVSDRTVADQTVLDQTVLDQTVLGQTAPDQTLVLEFTLPARQQMRFQAMLQAEDGLAVVRCFDPEKKKHQLWTPAVQKEELYEWLESLPESLELKLLRQWYWGDVSEGK